MVGRGRDESHTGGGVAGFGNPGVDLGTGQLAALAGLGALGHFDLDFAGGYQVFAGDAEAGGGHLLDGGIALGAVAVLGFATLAGVGLAAQTVHGNGHALVSFFRKRTVTHSRSLETLDDGFYAFHFVQGHTLLGIVELQQAAQMHLVAALVGYRLGVLLEGIVVAGPAGLLQQVDGLGIVQVLLGSGAAAELVGAQAGQFTVDIQPQRIEGFLVAGFQIVLDVMDGNTAHTGDGVGEVLVDHFLAQAQGFKNLAARVGLNGGNAHLGGDLHDARQNGFVVVLHGGVVVLIQQTFVDEAADGLLRQIGIDGTGAVAQQGGKVVHQPRLAAFQNQCHGRALAGADQVLAHGAHSQQAGDGHVVFVDLPVREDQDVGAVPVGTVHIHEQTLDGFLQIGVLVVADGQGFNFKTGYIHRLDLQKIGFGQDGVVDLEDLAVVGLFFQQVALGAYIDGGGGNDLLTQGVNGRVGDLGEHLLEVFKQGRPGVAQHSQRGIAAHGTGRLTAVLGHGQNDGGNILVAVAESLLQLHQLLFVVAGGALVGHFQSGQIHKVAVQPLAVGLTAGVIVLQLFVVHKFALLRIHQQHLAGAQSVFAHDLVGGNIQYAHLAGKNQPAILGDVVTAGTQTVAVQHGAHHIAVTEQDAGGAVPRLQHGGIVLVEIPLLGVHGLVVAPGLGDGHHHGQGKVHAVHDHEFQGVIQHGRVRTALVDDGQHLGHVVFQIVGADGFLPGQHGVHIAADGVDLAVVQNQAVGVCPVPAGCRVGGEAAVHHANGGFVIAVLQIGIEQAQFVDQEHTLVDDGPAGQAADIGIGAGLLKHAAGYIQAAVKGNAGLQTGRFAHKALPDAGHAVPGFVAQNFGADGNFAPPQERQPLFFADDLKQFLGLVAAQFILREEEHTNAVFPLLAQVNAKGSGSFLEKLVADLGQDANTVAGFALGVLAGAMLQMLHDLQRILDGFMGLAALDVHHRADTAVVMFQARVIQAGRLLHRSKVLHCKLSFLVFHHAATGKIPFATKKGRPPAGSARLRRVNVLVLAYTIP